MTVALTSAAWSVNSPPADGESKAALAREFGISRQTVYAYLPTPAV